ncbi:MAG: CCRG-2 family RiPP [Synechococcus sp. s2_metabat2_7]|nr:CCRG-2 family RiPP [Synechococcus sp. s2_metabat2_7]
MTNNELTLDQLKEVNGGFFGILKALYNAYETSTENIRRAEKGIVQNRIWLTIKEDNETCVNNPPGSDIADSDPTAQF